MRQSTGTGEGNEPEFFGRFDSGKRPRVEIGPDTAGTPVVEPQDSMKQQCGCPVNESCEQSRFEDSNDASRISAPLRPKLAQTNKVEPRAKIANVNVGTENDDVIL